MPTATHKRPNRRYDDTVLVSHFVAWDRSKLADRAQTLAGERTTSGKGSVNMPTPTGRTKGKKGAGALSVIPNPETNGSWSDVFELLGEYRGTTISYPISEDWIGTDKKGEIQTPSAQQVFLSVMRESITLGPEFMVEKVAVYQKNGDGVIMEESYTNKAGESKTRQLQVGGIVEIQMAVEDSKRTLGYMTEVKKMKPQWFIAELEILAAEALANDEESE